MKGDLVTENFPIDKNPWLDSVCNNQAIYLVSEKMKTLIDANLLGEEGIVWKKTMISHREIRIYYVLCFSKQLDVLDMEKTIFVEGNFTCSQTVFSQEKIKGKFQLFHQPN